jgi:hypothetical protein
MEWNVVGGHSFVTRIARGNVACPRPGHLDSNDTQFKETGTKESLFRPIPVPNSARAVDWPCVW